jgi:hypothetical protein
LTVNLRRRPRPRAAAAGLILAFVLARHGVLARAPDEVAAELRVLFVGNSLTQANDLPGMVESLARAAGRRPLAWRAVLRPGASLEDHWIAGDARGAIAAERWDFVVLQQGPSALPESRALLLRDAQRFAREIRAAGGRPVLYMVWPASSRPGDFDGVSLSYRSAARDVDGLLAPAGDAWRIARSRDPRVELYGPDGFHPTPEGTYLAALVLYGALYGQTPVGSPGRLTDGSGSKVFVDVSPARARLLQEAAAEASRRELRASPPPAP